MVAKVRCTTLVGIDAIPIDVETQITGSLKRFSLVGLPDGVLKESKDRVRCAIENCGFSFPSREVIVSLAPASLPKFGAGFDVAIAVSILAADGQIRLEGLKNRIMLGELALDGMVRPVPGVLAAACFAKDQFVKDQLPLQLIVPEENGRQAALIAEIKIFTVSSLVQMVSFLNQEVCLTPLAPSSWNPFSGKALSGFGDVVGQHAAKRAMEIVASGGHNLLMVGPPGAGKSMLAERLISILPELTPQEAIEVTRIYSSLESHSRIPALLENQRKEGRSQRTLFITTRPFRSPHHSTSNAGLIGGGSNPLPGEISLAHRGVLFLDELTEFKRDVLESLRQPLETRNVVISRAKLRVSFPADFVLVAAMNPCPCGRRGSGEGRCDCSPQAFRRYQARLSGPFLDRIDLQIWVPRVPITELGENSSPDSTPEMRQRIFTAREQQEKRFRTARKDNAHMTPRDLKQCCNIGGPSLQLIQKGAEKFGFSARAYTRTLKVARTIADLESSTEIAPRHIAEALSYRIAEGRVVGER